MEKQKERNEPEELEAETKVGIEEEPIVSESLGKEIKSAILSKKLIKGVQSVLKALKENKIKKVILVRDTPKKLRSEIEKYAQMVNTPIDEYPGNQKLFGVECQRSHNVIIAAILK